LEESPVISNFSLNQFNITGETMKHFIDIETTGLNNEYHEIIEIAVITVHDSGKIENYYSKIRPMNLQRAHPKALEINGYTPAAWANSPTIDEIAPILHDILKRGIIIGHNPSFDMGFINNAFFNVGLVPRRNRLIDTTVLVHEHLYPLGCKGLSMDNVRAFFAWDNRLAHTAQQDALDCKRLYDKLFQASAWDRFKWKLAHKLRS
jgi:DNA polymerase III epsilon subunit family exonuclease